MEPVVVSVGTLTSGARANNIAETAEFKGTIRYFNPKLQYTIEESFKRISLISPVAKNEISLRIGAVCQAL